MSENVILTLYIATVTVFGGWNIVLTLLWWTIRSDIKDTNLALILFAKGMGQAAAEIIHRDDDLWGIDAILDRYRAHDHELPLEDWVKLREVMNRLHNDGSVPHGTKIAIASIAFQMLGELALHKIHGKNPQVIEAVKEVLGGK